jgi:hypothetical protein
MAGPSLSARLWDGPTLSAVERETGINNPQLGGCASLLPGPVACRFTTINGFQPATAFEIGEQAYGARQDADGSPERDERGQPKFEQFIGGSEYWFLLRDFAGTEAQKP